MKYKTFGAIIILLIMFKTTFAQRESRIKFTDGICDSTLFKYTATSRVNDVMFSWERPMVIGIENKAQKGNSANIKEYLKNSTNDIVIVNYIFKMTLVSGCSHTDTLKVGISPTPTGKIEINPSKSIYWGDKRILNFKTDDLTQYSYNWSFGDDMTLSTNSNPVIHYYYSSTIGDASLKVEIKNKFGCVKTFSTIIHLLGDTTSVTNKDIKIPKKYSLAAYPIPFTTKLYLKYSIEATQKARYIVNDLAGKIIYNEEITLLGGSNINVLPSEKIQKGLLYTIKIISNNINYEEKIFRK